MAKRPEVVTIDLENNMVSAMYFDHKVKNDRGGSEIRRLGIFVEMREKDKDGKFILPIDPGFFEKDKYDKQERKWASVRTLQKALTAHWTTFLRYIFPTKTPLAMGQSTLIVEVRFYDCQKLAKRCIKERQELFANRGD